MKCRFVLCAILSSVLLAAAPAPAQNAQTGSLGSADTNAAIPKTDLIQPLELATELRQGSPKPLILQVGSKVLFEEAHITGSEYAGPAGSFAGLKVLGARVSAVKKDQRIVIYCGCCPWERCPNIRPAYNALRTMGFSHVKALYLPENFGADWVSKGYPTDKAQ